MANPFDDEPVNASRQHSTTQAGNSNIRRFNFFDDEEEQIPQRGSAVQQSPRKSGSHQPTGATTAILTKTTTTQIRATATLNSTNPYSSSTFASTGQNGGSDNSAYGMDQPATQQKSETERIWDEVEAVQQRSLASTHNSLRYIEDSEQAGLSTAGALLKQREQLENVDRNLNTMDQSLNTAQKHINSLKSVFGGVRNYFGGKTPPLAQAAQKSPGSSALRSVLDKQQNAPVDSNKPPGSWNKSGLYNDEARAAGRSPLSNTSIAHGAAPAGSKSTFDTYENQLDANLEMMGGGVSRLKDLALGLSSELDDQNATLDKINVRADQVGTKVAVQDKQLGRLLGRK